MDPAGVTVLRQSVRWSVRSWLIAVAAGVLETVIHAVTREDYNAEVSRCQALQIQERQQRP